MVIAGDRQLEDLVRRCVHALAGVIQQPIDRVDHQTLHFDQPFISLGVDDAGDHVLAAGDLAVVVRGLGHDLTALEVHQPDGDGGGADVHRRAEVALGPVAGQEGQQLRWAVGAIPIVQRDHRSHFPRYRSLVPDAFFGRLRCRRTVLPAEHARHAAHHAQGGLGSGHVKRCQRAGDTRPVVGLVGEGGRVETEEITPDRLVVPWVVVERDFDLRRGLVRGQPALDGFLRRHRDPRIPFDHRLAGKRIPCRHILRRQADRGTAAHGGTGVVHDHGTAAAAPLPAARLVQIEPGQPRRLRQHAAGGDGDGDVAGLEVNGIGSQGKSPVELGNWSRRGNWKQNKYAVLSP